MTTKQIAKRARWMAAYENHITILRPQMAGKIDWHTATFYFNSGVDAFSAAHRWMMNHPLEKKPVTPQVEALDGMTPLGFSKAPLACVLAPRGKEHRYGVQYLNTDRAMDYFTSIEEALHQAKVFNATKH